MDDIKQIHLGGSSGRQHYCFDPVRDFVLSLSLAAGLLSSDQE
jgi:hypothetical protein